MTNMLPTPKKKFLETPHSWRQLIVTGDHWWQLYADVKADAQYLCQYQGICVILHKKKDDKRWLILQKTEENHRNSLNSCRNGAEGFTCVLEELGLRDYEVNTMLLTQFSRVWLSIGSDSSPKQAASLSETSNSQDMNTSIIATIKFPFKKTFKDQKRFGL